MHASRSFVFAALTASALVNAYDAADLFPIPVQQSWTTSQAALGIPSGTRRIALDDKALNVTKDAGGQPHDLVDAPGNGVAGKVWRAFYPQGSWNPSGSPEGGFGLYFTGPGNIWEGLDEILFSYAVFFPQNFNFVMGGKLPGPYGGETPELATGCTGGRQEDRDKCFDLRLMWRTDGAGEIYAYLPELQSNTDAAQALEGTVIDTSYGASLARGAYNFASGEWTVVAERVRLNTPGKADGELELWANGKSVIHATNLTIRSDGASTFRGVHFQTFFGGSTSDWATPTDQYAYFADVSGAMLAANASPADGKAAYPLASETPSGTHTTTKGPAPTSGNGSGNANTIRLPISTVFTTAIVSLLSLVMYV